MPSFIEGRNPVLEALRADVPVSRLMLAEGVREDRSVQEMLREARERGVPVERVPRRVLDGMSERGSHQGVVAEAAGFSYFSLEEVVAEADRPWSLLLALDHVTDPGNLGAVARSAEVAGADGLVVTSRRSAPVTPAAHKTSAGALAHLPVARVPNLPGALQSLKQRGYWIAGASESARSTVWEAPMEGRLVIVLGAEGKGLSRLVEQRCDFLVRLPVAGRVGSLNVAQAATALAFEWVRRSRVR